MKYPFRLLFLMTFFLFLFGCTQKTEIASEGDDSTAPSSESSLSGLTITGVSLTPGFDPGTETYTATVANDVDSITITPDATDGGATITVNGTDVSSGAGVTIRLPVGDTVISIVVTAEDGTNSTYTVTVTREAEALPPPVSPPSTDSSLANLVLSEGTLAPGFSSALFSYTASVSNDVVSITVTPTATDTNATITVNGSIVASGSASQPIALAEGDNAISVLVTAEDGTSKSTYVVSVNRASLNTDSSLSNLTLSDGTLSPAFDSATQSYTASVSNDVVSITVTPTAADTNATIAVNGSVVASGQTSQAIVLVEGDNAISVLVTAEDGTTKSTYVVTVNRASLSKDSSLSNLTLSEGTIAPAFDSATQSYTASLSYSVDAITVTPTTSDANATVTVNGTTVASGSASGSIDLIEGDNIITVVVTAEDGTTTQTYTVTVTREAASTDASLSDLTLSGTTLDQIFQSNSYDYTATVAYAIASTTVTPTTNDTNATVAVNGTAVTPGSASGSIALNEGDNIITVVVTAEDGTTTQTYTVTVTREAASTDASLSDLTLSATTLDQIFQSNSYDYTATVAYAIASTTVTPTTNDTNATVVVNGTAVTSGSASGSIALNEGDNIITVVVTAEDGTTMQSYTVTVTRESAQTFAQQAYIKASNTGPNDAFGYAVALDGDTLAVGAFQQGGTATSTPSSSGAAYVFTRTSGVWSQEAYIKASVPGYGYNFGAAVALQGDTLVVGEPNEGRTPASSSLGAGAAYVFVRNSGVWTQQAKIVASNGDDDDDFGYSVAVDGDVAAIGAPGEDSSAIDGEADNSIESAGAVYVFTRSGTNWTQQAYLKASNAGLGHGFGTSIDLEAGTLVVGAPYENDSVGRGAVYVFSENVGNWVQQAQIKGEYIRFGNDYTNQIVGYGHAVALSGDTLAVGAPNSFSNFGVVFVHTWTGTNWEQQGFVEASNRAQYDVFGNSVSLSGDLLAVGAQGQDDGGNNAGAAYLFSRNGTSWSQIEYVKASNADPYDAFGNAVAVSGDTLAVGAYGEDSSATGIDGDQSLNDTPTCYSYCAGAVYVFQ